MSRSFDVDPCDHLAAGAVGEPGARTFYLQARGGGASVTILAEKQQVAALAETLQRMADTLGEEGEPAPPADLEEPFEPEWRAGNISLEYDEDADAVAIVIQESLPEEAPEEPATLRIVASRAQIRALATRALEVVEAGRPTCNLCGFPLDPDGHACPALNGHRSRAE